MLPAIDKARPLTLQEVLRLRDGLEVVRGNISGYPLQVILPNYNRKELMVLCKN